MKKIELLSPAGSIEAFHTAIDSGADAIYCGVDSLNARLRAKNFSISQLSYLIPYAHSKDVKVYITLNTLLKNSEIELLINLLYKLSQLKVDAVIVQDFGIVEIASKYFPELELHASTQMAIHNLDGVKVAESLGIKRVILARELTNNEIKYIVKNSSLEIEVFVHGALCYSVSGLCMASSYLGGMSGNRGKCTQVCRRKFNDDNKSGFYFSPKDLCGASFINEMEKIGVSSIKIEGRMKSAEYVQNVISSYRKLIDKNSELEKVTDDLKRDFGREKTTFFLNGGDKNILLVKSGGGTGIFIDKIIEIENGKLIINRNEDINIGDRIRIQGEKGFEGISLKILNITHENDKTVISFNSSEKIVKGSSIFLLSRKKISNQLEKNRKIDIKPIKIKQNCPFSSKIIKQYGSFRNKVNLKKSNLILKIDHYEWLFHLKNIKVKEIIIDFDYELLEEFLCRKKILKQYKERLILTIPPVIYEENIKKWKDIIKKVRNIGIKKFMVQNISHFSIFSKKDILYSDYNNWCMNNGAKNLFRKLGLKKITISMEDDILNIKRMSNDDSMIYLFSYVPLFISRVKPGMNGDSVIDSKKDGFFTIYKHGLYYTYGEKPLSLFNKREILQKNGINDFIIDLSLGIPSKKYIKELLFHYKEKKRVENSTMFNFKIGLK